MLDEFELATVVSWLPVVPVVWTVLVFVSLIAELVCGIIIDVAVEVSLTVEAIGVELLILITGFKPDATPEFVIGVALEEFTTGIVDSGVDVPVVGAVPCKLDELLIKFIDELLLFTGNVVVVDDDGTTLTELDEGTTIGVLLEFTTVELDDSNSLDELELLIIGVILLDELTAIGAAELDDEFTNVALLEIPR